jgi:tetratricopeptide (TPR) repeat protein
MLTGQSVHDAIDAVVRPLTMSPKCSVAQALKRKAAKDEAGKPYVAPATVLFTYTDGALVTDVLEAVERYAASQPKVEDVYVQLDLLCSNQHAEAPSSLPMLWWQSCFRQGVKSIGAVCLALLPWDEPPALRRSWCLWQLHTALSLSLPIHIATTAKEDAKLREKLVQDMDAPMKQLDTRRDGFKSQAEGDTDAQKALVEKAIEKGHEHGYEEFGRKLADVLHKWLLERAKKVLEELPSEQRGTSTLVDRVAKLLHDFGDLEAAEPLCREQVESRAKALGEHHTDTLEACNNLALLLHQLGKLEEAEPYSRRKLAGCRATLGDRHPDTITAIDTTSQLLSDLGKLDQAMPLKRESLAEKRRTLGDRHPDTLLSVNNLAVLLNDLGRQTGDLKLLREAEPLKREALAGCREVLGNRHPHTLASVANLADLLMQLAPADPRAIAEAEPLARESLAGTREVLGGGHPETLKSVGMMATLLVEKAHQHKPKSAERARCFAEAEPLYREAVQGFTKGLTQYHPTPLSYSHELSRLLLDMGKAKDAEKLSRESVKGCRASLGDSHPETLIAITHLSAILRGQNRLDEAAVLAREVRLGWMQLEADAPVPRNTLTASNILAELLHSMGNNDEALPLCRDVLNGFLRAVGPQHPFTMSAADNLSNVLRAVGHSDEADKVLKQFGMKTPVGGAIMEEGEEEEDEDDEPPQQPTGNGKAKAKAKAKAAASASNGKAKAQQGGSSPTRPVKIDDDCEDVD